VDLDGFIVAAAPFGGPSRRLLPRYSCMSRVTPCRCLLCDARPRRPLSRLVEDQRPPWVRPHHERRASVHRCRHAGASQCRHAVLRRPCSRHVVTDGCRVVSVCLVSRQLSTFPLSRQTRVRQLAWTSDEALVVVFESGHVDVHAISGALSESFFLSTEAFADTHDEVLVLHCCVARRSLAAVVQLVRFATFKVCSRV
jgi:hypothetical protein